MGAYPTTYFNRDAAAQQLTLFVSGLFHYSGQSFSALENRDRLPPYLSLREFHINIALPSIPLTIGVQSLFVCLMNSISASKVQVKICTSINKAIGTLQTEFKKSERILLLERSYPTRSSKTLSRIELRLPRRVQVYYLSKSFIQLIGACHKPLEFREESFIGRHKDQTNCIHRDKIEKNGTLLWDLLENPNRDDVFPSLPLVSPRRD